MTRAAWILVAAAATAAALPGPAAADDVVLRGSVRLDPAATSVRLADVAELSGPGAEQYAGLVLAEIADPTATLEISVQQVRDALGAAGVHWGKVQLSGRSVLVRPASQPSATAPRLMAPARLDTRAPPTAPETPAQPGAAAWEDGAALADLPTVRGGIARTLLGANNVPPERLRLAFEPRDAAILDTPLASAGFEIQPLSNLDTDRVEISLRAWSGGRIERQQAVTVRPMVQIDAAVLCRDINRGETLHEEDCLVEQRWVSPLQASTHSSLIEAVGRVADSPLKAGDVLKKKYFKREVLVKRGDRVVVRCLVGGVVISMEAEARGDGLEGEKVELRKIGERATFFGTVAGPGSVIVDLAR